MCLIQVSSGAPILIVQDVKKCLLSDLCVCVFFWCLVRPLQHQVHAEEKISLFILEDLVVGFHCFSGRHLFAREVRGEERKSVCRNSCALTA